MANAFGLVYQNAIERNEPGRVNIQTVEYEAEGIMFSLIHISKSEKGAALNGM